MRPITVSVGPNAPGGTSSPWVRLDQWSLPQIAVQCNVSGTVNYTVESTLDDTDDPTNPVAAGSVSWFNSSDPSAVGATAPIQSNFAFCPTFVRVVMNSGTGTVTMKVSQAGSSTY